jgi:hypothetical protein
VNISEIGNKKYSKIEFLSFFILPKTATLIYPKSEIKKNKKIKNIYPKTDIEVDPKTEIKIKKKKQILFPKTAIKIGPFSAIF